MRAVTIAVLLLLTRHAHAQYYPVDFTQQTFNAMNIATNYVNTKVLLDSSIAVLKSKGDGKPASTITSGKANVARRLAAAYPEAKRGDAERVFGALLEAYPKIELQYDIPSGDIAGAFALFVIASYEAYTKTEVAPAQSKKVIAQVRGALATSRALASAKPQDRRALYEQMVILGMFIAIVNGQVAQHPELADTVHDAAKGYLAGMLKLDPDRVRIDDGGLAIR